MQDMRQKRMAALVRRRKRKRRAPYFVVPANLTAEEIAKIKAELARPGAIIFGDWPRVRHCSDFNS